VDFQTEWNEESIWIKLTSRVWCGAASTPYNCRELRCTGFNCCSSLCPPCVHACNSTYCSSKLKFYLCENNLQKYSSLSVDKQCVFWRSINLTRSCIWQQSTCTSSLFPLHVHLLLGIPKNYTAHCHWCFCCL
jgi:hypothetical protein